MLNFICTQVLEKYYLDPKVLTAVEIFDPETVMLAKVNSFFDLLSKMVPLKYLNELESLLLKEFICASDCIIARKKKDNPIMHLKKNWQDFILFIHIKI